MNEKHVQSVPLWKNLRPSTVTHQNIKKVLYARKLRRRMTDAEIILWEALRDRRCAGIKFRRQVALGPFIIDFCTLLRYRWIIEVDGSVHRHYKEYDNEREQMLMSGNFRMLRFTNEEIMQNLEKGLQKIQTTILPIG